LQKIAELLYNVMVPKFHAPLWGNYHTKDLRIRELKNKNHN